MKYRDAKPDLATFAGLFLALAGLVGGLLMEGGRIRDVAQFSAAFIVFGGTLGAVLVSTPLSVVMRAARQMKYIFLDRPSAPLETIDEMIAYARQARRRGIRSLEQSTPLIEDDFLRKALDLAVDGIEPEQIRNIMELEISAGEQNGEAEAKVFEAAGGYSPTIGIIGAVLGLVQVMKSLTNMDVAGRGIAVAFVATVYGVAAANLFFLPAAGKLRSRTREIVRQQELMLDGVLLVAEGLNPRLIQSKLEIYAQASAPEEISKRNNKLAGDLVPAAG